MTRADLVSVQNPAYSLTGFFFSIGKHINNALQEELAVDSVGAKNATTQSRKNPTIANFATVQREGNRTVTRQIEYYNLDVILSVGYRVKSNRGIQFRRWANQVLKQHLLNGYSINRHLVSLQQQMDSRFEALEQKVDEQQQQVEFLVDMHRQPEDRLFPTGLYTLASTRLLMRMWRSTTSSILP